MPDHVHTLLAFPPDQRMDRAVAAFKKYLSRKTGINWQRDFFDHRLRNEESLQLKTDYIRQNPVRAGLAECADDWPYVWDPKR